MEPPPTIRTQPPDSPAPRRGLQMMGVILLAMALLAIFSNVQRARREQLETVTITRAPSPSPSPTAAASASASPAVP